MENTVWHYAPWSYLSRIILFGALRVSNAGAPSEVPLLWFSSNQVWEPTATKLIDRFGIPIRMTFEQQSEKAGCVRFGLPGTDSRLLDWKQACAVAGTPCKAVREMEKLGKKLGANRNDWFATRINVPLEQLRFQVWLQGWHDAEYEEMATVWEEAHERKKRQ